MNSYRFLASRRWVGAFVALLAFAVLCHLLAQWQLARRAEAQAEIARVQTNYDATPVAIAEALPTLDAYSMADKWRQVQLTGHYLPEFEVLVRNRPCAGAAGYQVITPFLLDSGASVFVDRGCVPAGSAANTAAPYRAVDNRETTVIVHLRASEPTVAGRIDSSGAVGSINAPSLAERFGLHAYTAAYGQLSGAEGGSAPFLPARPIPDEGPHLSYAFQWYVYTLIAAMGYGWAARNERRARQSDAEDARVESAKPSSVQPAEGRHEGSTGSAAQRLSNRYGQAGAGGRRKPERKRQSSDADFEDAQLGDSME